jgi:hypothetical protein
VATSKTTEAKAAIDVAIALLTPQSASADAPAAAKGPGIQASDARAVLDVLVASNPEKLLSGELNLRHMTESLFDWHGTKRSTKPLLHAFHNALQVPGRYDHAVELTAFLSALSPLLDADRLARLYALTTQVETVYAPVRYTVSLSNKLQSVLGSYQPQRIEQLASTLWVDAHAGRWWDMTDGVAPDPDAEAPDEQDADEDPVKQLIENGRTTWSERAARAFANLPYDERVHERVREYVQKANKGIDVDVDLSVLAAGIGWLPILDRPESPIGPLINTLRQIREALGEAYTCPAKPKRFRDLFPDVRIYGDRMTFPHHPEVQATHGLTRRGVRLELVRTAAELQENRAYMGNCTWSYKNRMDKGTYALYRVHYDGHIYNAAMTAAAGTWRVGEVNSRFNRGNVPAIVHQTFRDLVRSMSAASAVEAQRGSEAASLRVKARFSVL